MKVTVFGAGVAGLTVAHELSRRGHTVSVYEARGEPGGFFRSEREEPEHLATEYSWHGFGPWYHNAFDLLRTIPAPRGGSMYDSILSRPIDFGIFPNDASARFYHGLASIPRMFRMTPRGRIRWWWLMLKTWAANRRTEVDYSTINAAAAWSLCLAPVAARTWRACFGPWIGSDWTRCSLHTAGQFFRRQLQSGPPHAHRADETGPAWVHGSRDGWLLLRGPSSEWWFDPWVETLRAQGVRFFWRASLHRLELADGKVRRAWLEDGREVRAECYVVAANPFNVADIVDRSPGLQMDPQMACFRPLVQEGPHVQVSMRIGFAEPVAFPHPRTAVVLADSEFNLTLFAEEQAWAHEVAMGKGIGSLWTVTSCTGDVPGRLYGLPVVRCTREQFIEEVLSQIRACRALDEMLRQANQGRGFADFTLRHVEVWHEWRFSPNGIGVGDPKWVTGTRTHRWRPAQKTGLPNLVLAGAHTRTAVDVWSIEGAVESGRRAAQAIDPRVSVVPQYKPLWLRALSALDDLCYTAAAPHLLDLTLCGLALALGAWVGTHLRRRAASHPYRGRPSPPPGANGVTSGSGPAQGEPLTPQPPASAQLSACRMVVPRGNGSG
ncbi:MAG: FAD-dependent oxidoreductase [Candidatus Xenobia bacterium]